MQTECYSISSLPGTSSLFRDFAEGAAPATVRRMRKWYPADQFRMDWAGQAPELSSSHREALANALLEQADLYKAGEPARANIERLRGGAAAVVTGQQVGLFGGPLLTLLKAATAIRKAADATQVSGREHVPVFWLASEDHDIAEVDHVFFPAKDHVARLSIDLNQGGAPVPAGSLRTAPCVESALATAEEILSFAPICEVLRDAYTDAPGYQATMASAFGRLLSHIFAEQGLVVVDASSRDLHSLGQPVLRAAIERASELEQVLLERSAALEAAGYHAQVKVAPDMSLLFLITPDASGVTERRALRRTSDGHWKSGGDVYKTAELLRIVEEAPERLSPNALLRPVFQDEIFPTAAYIGGPAEIAYFAQSAVVYEKLLGRVTAVLPRLSATLVEPAIAKVLASHELQVPDIFAAKTSDALTMRLGARAMPVEGKRRLSSAGNALDGELSALLEYMNAVSPELGRAAGVSASKMRYQMNRLRLMAARFQTEKEGSLGKHAKAVMLSLFPDEHLQERLLAGVFLLARLGDSLPGTLVDHAGQECPGHRVLFF